MPPAGEVPEKLAGCVFRPIAGKFPLTNETLAPAVKSMATISTGLLSVIVTLP